MLSSRDIQIRRAGPEHLPAVIRIEAKSFGADAWSQDLFEWYLAAFPGLFLVAVRNGRVAGYVLGSLRGSRGEIDSVAVLPGQRRHGTGTALMKALVRRFRRAGAQSISLMVRPENVAAIRLYRALGFVRRSTVYRYYSDGSRAWRMRLMIGGRPL